MPNGRQSRRLRFAAHVWLAVLAPIVVGVVVALITGAWSPFSDDGGPDRTKIRLFATAAYFGRPAAGVKIAERKRGDCGVSSNVNPVPNAHRRVALSHGIYDPCFGGWESDLLCLASPWTRDWVQCGVRRFNLEIREGEIVQWDPNGPEPMPDLVGLSKKEDVIRRSPPWAVELANEHRCVLVSGATFVVAGQRGNYECSKTTGFNGGQGAWLIGWPDRSSQPWSVSYLPAGSFRTDQVDVVVAWY